MLLHVFDRPARLGLLLVAPAVLITALSLAYGHRLLTQSALSRRSRSAHLAAVILGERFHRIDDVALSLATRPQFRKHVSAGRWSEAIRIMADVPTQFPFIHRVLLADPRGIERADAPVVAGGVGLDVSHREWYREAIRGEKPHLSSIYTRTVAPQYNVFALSAPIREQDGPIWGVIMFQIRLATLFEWSRGLDVGPGSAVYFVDPMGHAAERPRPDQEPVLANLSGDPALQTLLRGEGGLSVGRDANGREFVSAYERIHPYGWGVLLRQPAELCFEDRNRSLRLLAVVYGLALLGQMGLVGAMARHLHRRRDAEKSLRASEERFRLLTASVKEYAIILLDAAGHVLSWNEGAQKINGYRQEEILGQHISRFYTPEDAQSELPKRLLERARIEGHVENEGWRVRKDGSRFWANVVLTPMMNSDGTLVGFTKITRDLTERKRSEDELQALNKELEAFSYSIAHDLRAPLRAIEGFSRIVIEDYAARLDAEGRRLLNVVRTNAKNMAALIDDLLNFSRLGRKTLLKNEVDMGALARSALASLGGAATDRFDFRLDPLPRARGDETLLREVFLNLLSNAIKYSRRKPRAVVEVGARSEPAEIIYFVKDNGEGFDMRYADKLFGVFQRLHGAEEFEGTGVGLAIVDRIVRRHGGKVWGEGKVGEGATFYFSLPKEG